MSLSFSSSIFKLPILRPGWGSGAVVPQIRDRNVDFHPITAHIGNGTSCMALRVDRASGFEAALICGLQGLRVSVVTVSAFEILENFPPHQL